MADLRAASLDDVRAFHRRYYAPNNAVLSFAGDFEPAEAMALVRNHFWRVLGIRLLASVVAVVVAGAVSVPFAIAGQVMLVSAETGGLLLFAAALNAVGRAVSQIITAPFTAGVVVLLYTDTRIRAEAFDLVLQTGAAGGPAATESTDNLWLTR